MRRQIVAQNPPDRCIQWYLAILAAFAVSTVDLYVAASRTDGYVPDLKAAEFRNSQARVKDQGSDGVISLVAVFFYGSNKSLLISTIQ